MNEPGNSVDFRSVLGRRPDSPDSAIEMEDSISSHQSSKPGPLDSASRRRPTLKGVARRTLGLILLLCVVFLWTLSNFLGSSIFADNTYAKPFFLTYFDTSLFILALLPVFARSGYQRHQAGQLRSTFVCWRSRRRSRPGCSEEPDDSESFLKPGERGHGSNSSATRERIHLGFLPTARLSLTFCILWFLANYFAMACLQYTTVASTTILTSTSSIWTLLVGTLTRTEKFTWRKLCGVLASLVGIIFISKVDLTPITPETPPASNPARSIMARVLNEFPVKSPAELALGDFMALFSALVYGVYAITLKKTTIKAQPLQLNMPLFFGLVGLFNAVILFPLFPIFHYTGFETFELPPSRRVWTVLLVNSFSSMFSDILWAYAMILTSPLVVTVGLSLTIPLSLIGEVFIQGRREGVLYWIGALIVVLSFVFVNQEDTREESEAADHTTAEALAIHPDETEIARRGSVSDSLLPTDTSRFPHQ